MECHWRRCLRLFQKLYCFRAALFIVICNAIPEGLNIVKKNASRIFHRLLSDSIAGTSGSFSSSAQVWWLGVFWSRQIILLIALYLTRPNTVSQTSPTVQTNFCKRLIREPIPCPFHIIFHSIIIVIFPLCLVTCPPSFPSDRAFPHSLILMYAFFFYSHHFSSLNEYLLSLIPMIQT